MRKIIILILITSIVMISGCSKSNVRGNSNAAIANSNIISSQIISNSSAKAIPTQKQTNTETTNENIVSTSNENVKVESAIVIEKETIKVLPTEQNFSQISSNKANPILRLYLLYCVQFYKDKLGDSQEELTAAENNKCKLILGANGRWENVADANAVNSAKSFVDHYQGQLDIFLKTSQDYNIDINSNWVLENNSIKTEPLLTNQIIGYISEYKNELNKSELYLKSVQDNKNCMQLGANGQWVYVADERLVKPALIKVRDNKRELKYWTSFAEICGINY